MANWNTNTKHSASSINNGNRYEIQDRVTLEQLNAITENSFYASEKVDTVISDAQDVVTQGRTEIENTTSQGKNELNAIVDDAEDLVAKANTSINTVVGTANEALFTVQQVVASKGYYGSNPNILINGDFRVNQRGQTSYSGTETYTVDRWCKNHSSVEFNVASKILKNIHSEYWYYFYQYIEDTSSLLGKNVAISAKINGTTYSATTKLNNSYSEDKNIVNASFTGGQIALKWDNSKKLLRFEFGLSPNAEYTIDEAKVEIGSVATAFNPRPYAEELAMCQRYYEKINTLIEGNNYNIFARVLNTNLLYNSLVNFVVEKRAKPTVNIYSTNNTQGYLLQVGTQDEKGVSANYITTKTFSISIKNNDAVANSVLSGYFEADAEIY